MRTLVETAMKGARQNFEQDGTVLPILISVGTKQNILAPLRFTDEEQKNAVLSALRLALRETGSVEYCLACESWAVSYSTLEEARARTVEPRHSERRIEVVSLVYANTSGEKEYYTAVINRPFDGPPSLDEFVGGKAPSGKLTSLLD